MGTFVLVKDFFLFVVCVDLTRQSPTTNKEDNYWIKELCLFKTDREFLRGSKWLSDAVVTASQHLLKELYPHVGGLQPTTLGLTLGFVVQKTEFVQILNLRDNHWVTVSNIGCPPATIQVFDSMPNIDLPPRAKAQIVAIMCVKEANIFLEFVSVQEQYGHSDCGVFEIAFATSLCVGHSPAKTT